MLLDCFEQKKAKIGIVGAGFAGLRAARHFEQVGLDYLILEGSNRIGGRVFPFEYQNGYLHYGAEYVNGIDNEIYQIVEKCDLLDKTDSRTSDLWMLDEGTITVINGKRVDSEKLQIWNEFVKSVNDKLNNDPETVMDLYKSVADKIDEYFTEFLNSSSFGTDDQEIFKNLCSIFKNYFQTEWSSPAHELGMKNFSTWEDGTTEEDSAVLNEFGFQKILEEFKARIPKQKIRLNTKVVNLNYGGIGVKILLENGESLHFDSVIVTCSLGFLKQHKRKLFSPSLSRHKENAIESMGFGSNMKVFLEYKQPWWPSETSTIMISSMKTTADSNSKLTDNLMVFQPSSWANNILVVWIAGSGPYEAALKTDNELMELIDGHLKDHLNGQLEVGNILRVFRHDWVDDEFALGSYSYLSPNDNDDIRVIAEPILKGDRPLVCFAGEHTDPEMYQTTVGAARSGLREAVRIHFYYSENNFVFADN